MQMFEKFKGQNLFAIEKTKTDNRTGYIPLKKSWNICSRKN